MAIVAVVHPRGDPRTDSSPGEPAVSTPKENGPDGRDSNGRFIKGNPGGPGNPYAKRVAQLRASLLEAVGDDGVAQIVRGLMTAAKGGDVAAAKLVFSYVLGTPGVATDPDAVAIHEKELADRAQSLDATAAVLALL